jgi:hypothetical protein
MWLAAALVALGAALLLTGRRRALARQGGR